MPLSVDADGLLRVTTAAGSGTSMTDDAAFTPGTTAGTPIFAEFDDTTPDSVDEGDAGIVRMSANRNLYGTIRDAAGNERGVNVDASNHLQIDIAASSATITVAAHAVTNAGTFVVQEDGAALTALQLIDDVVYSEDVASGAADPGLAVYAVRDDALAANAGVGADGDYLPFRVNNDGALWTQPSAGNLGGCKAFSSVDLDQTEEDIATGACTVFSIYAWNLTAAPLWLQIFNTNTVTVGTTAPTFNYMIPANADSDGAGVQIAIPVQGLAFSTALTMAITTASGTTNGAPGAGDAGVFVTYQD